MNNKTLQEMNDAYKDCPVRTAEYTIAGKKYTVKSHFVGEKSLDDTLYREKGLPNSALCAIMIMSNLAALFDKQTVQIFDLVLVADTQERSYYGKADHRI